MVETDMMNWNLCERKFVRKVNPDIERAKSIRKKDLQRLKRAKETKLDLENVSFIVEDYYEVIKELLTSYLLINGLRSKNHGFSSKPMQTCTFMCRFKTEGFGDIELLKNIRLERSYIDEINDVKEARITTQYEVSEEFEKRKANEVIEGAGKFFDRLEKLFYEIIKRKVRKMEIKKEFGKRGILIIGGKK